jgi:hypothetical protein
MTSSYNLRLTILFLDPPDHLQQTLHVFSRLGVLRWPVDVLLYMLSFCSLEDSLSFSMVRKIFVANFRFFVMTGTPGISKDMHTLAAQKAFWIIALRNERWIRPIACPYHEDITTHDIHSLRRIALHTRRLERNWDSANPQVLGPIKTVSLGFPALDILFQVPGNRAVRSPLPYTRNCRVMARRVRTIVSGPFGSIHRRFAISLKGKTCLEG